MKIRHDIDFKSKKYMTRWLVGSKKGYGFRVHKIQQSDIVRALHDHPFSFVSFILKGGYYEILADGTRTWHGPGSVLFRSAEVLHRLELPLGDDGLEIPAWTFVIRGRYRREWGFVSTKEWIPNSNFLDKRGT